jgi:hypothetical protein
LDFRTEFSDRTALAPNLAKILLVAERKGGAITIRDAQCAFNAKFRPTAQVTKLWFSELVAFGYGRVEKFGKSLIFQNTPRAVTVGDICPQNHIELDLGTVTNAVTVGDSSYKSSLPTVTNCHQKRSRLNPCRKRI